MHAHLAPLRIWIVAILAGLAGIVLALILFPEPDFHASLLIF